jgi:hypothetical protein
MAEIIFFDSVMPRIQTDIWICVASRDTLGTPPRSSLNIPLPNVPSQRSNRRRRRSHLLSRRSHPDTLSNQCVGKVISFSVDCYLSRLQQTK